MIRHLLKVGSITFALLLNGPLAGAHGQPALAWESRFDSTMEPGIEYPAMYAAAVPSSGLALAPGDDFYFYALDRLGKPTVSRLNGVDHSPVWSRLVTVGQNRRHVLRTLSLIDGGTLVVSGGLARFSAGGALLWSRPLRTEGRNVALEYENGDIAIVDHRETLANRDARVLRLDTLTGALIAGTVFGTGNGCSIRLLGTAGDALYVGGCDSHVHKLGTDLSTLWRVPHIVAAGLADASGVYLSGTGAGSVPEVVKLAAADGAIAWRRDGAWHRIGFDTAGNLLGQFVDGQTTRLDSVDATSGSQRWSSLWDSSQLIVAPSGDAIYLAGRRAGASSFVARVNSDTGSHAWSSDLQAGSGRAFLASSLLANTHGVWVSGSDCLSEMVCRIGLTRVDSLSGAQAAVEYPQVPQSVTVAASPDGGDALLVSSAEGAGAEQRVRAKLFDAAGPAAWEATFVVGASREGVDSALAFRTADAGVLVSANTVGLSYPYLARFGADRSVVWDRLMRDVGRDRANVSFASDPNGDVIAAVARLSNVSGTSVTSVERLDGSSGQTQWTVSVGSGFSAMPPSFQLVGTDVLMRSSLAQGVARVSGANAALRWNNPGLVDVSPFAIEGKHAYVSVGSEIVAFSMTDGTTQWMYRYIGAVGSYVSMTSIMVGDDGDLYVGGVQSSESGESGFVFRLDSQSGSPVWIQDLDAASGAPTSGATVRDVSADEVWLTQAGDFRTFFTRLDAGTGEFIDGSLLSTASGLDEGIGDHGARYGRRLADGAILAYGAAREPGMAAVPWSGKLIAPDLGARGDLSTSFVIARAQSGLEHLVAEFTYDGAAAVEAALAYLQFGEPMDDGMLPYVAGLQNVACVVTGGGTCVATPTTGGVRATLNLAPGARARLTARARVLPGMQLDASAQIYAPYGFFEQDLANNRKVQRFGDRLFVDGFDEP